MNGDPAIYNQLHFKWKTISAQLGVSPKTLKRWCLEAGLELPHWHGVVRPEPVWLPRAQVGLLLGRLLRSRVRQKLIVAIRRKRLSIQGLLPE